MSLPPEASPLDEQELPEASAAVLVELKKLESGRSGAGQDALLLVGSLGLFIALGVIAWDLADLLILVGVLLLHEGGHYLGMRVFGFREVRMFFIPLLGAAVSGHKYEASGNERGVVLLLGPGPGIILGFGLAAWVAFVQWDPLLVSAAEMLIILNAFNLAPMFPLDGGRLLQESLFRWVPILEPVCLAVGGLIVAGQGIYFRDWLFVPLGVFLFMMCSPRYNLGKVVRVVEPYVRDVAQPDPLLFGELGFDSILPGEAPITYRDHVAVATRVEEQVFVIDPPVAFQRPLAFSRWCDKLRRAGSTMPIEVSICSPLTVSHNSFWDESDPANEVGIRQGKPLSMEFFAQEFLEKEWQLLETLGYDPAAALGDHPPWADVGQRR